ncbi:F-box and leucine-rich repeat protein 4 [Mortierella sp. GBA30]|nr:F-box and leucine-rich repeat protein 4 [Mortierella sp. GBA30]
MNERPSLQVLSIPEIFSMIIDYLDAATLFSASLVCKNWRRYTSPILWRQLVIPKDWFLHDLKSLWPVLDRQGSLVRALSLELSPTTRMIPAVDMSVVTNQLRNILSRTPNVERLSIQFPRELKSSIVLTIAEYSFQLKQFETDLFNWDPKDMSALLTACPNLRHITGHDFTGKILEAIATSQPKLDRIDCTHPRFDDEELITFAAQYPDLLQLSVSLHQFLTAKALKGVAKRCFKIEHLSFHFCLSLASSGFRALLQVSPNLRFLDLGLTEVRDADIELVAAHCPRLESLRLPYCSNITHESISAIVHTCHQLRHLDISWCDRVLLSIFNIDSPWVCRRLRHLDISGIHASYSAEASMASALLPSMYNQLSLLVQLQCLKLSGHGFSLQLLDLGRPFFSKLIRLETLDISKIRNPIAWKDMIAIGNLFPRLREFQFRSSDVIPPLSASEQAAIDSAKRAGEYAKYASTDQNPGGFEVETRGASAETSSKVSGRNRSRSSESLSGMGSAERDTDSSSSDRGPSKKTPSTTPSPSPLVSATALGQRTFLSTTTSIAEQDQHECMKTGAVEWNEDAHVDGVISATLRSGIKISFRVNGEDIEDGQGGDGWGNQGAMAF